MDRTTSSILDAIGQEITPIITPVSICMLLVVLLVSSLSPPSFLSSPAVRTAANLVYLETPSDTPSHKLQGALLNALVFVLIVAAVTFLLLLLYYYNFTNFLKYYMRFSAFFVLATMGGSIFLSLITHFSVPIDSPTCFILLFNFTIVGVLSVFSNGMPILLKQSYMVLLGVIVAAWFTNLPEWTTWVLLVALALYDLVAVLAPGGPLKILVQLASSREDELPALVYEARPTMSRNGDRGSSLGLLVGGVSSEPSSVELQVVSRGNERVEDSEHMVVRIGADGMGIEEGETSPLVDNVRERRSFGSESSEFSVDASVDRNRQYGHVHLVDNVRERRSISSGSSEYSVDASVDRNRNRQYGHVQSEIVADEERSPLVEMLGSGNDREGTDRGGSDDSGMMTTRGIKLGLGDFVFYSVLVGRAAMYDLMTVYACYLAIISGLGCTLILLAVCRHALPALPISIFLGVMFYFLTRLLMEPFVVGTSTNLMMF